MYTRTERRWLEHLSEEDLAFLKRFLLASGTLKELARVIRSFVLGAASFSPATRPESAPPPS